MADVGRAILSSLIKQTSSSLTSLLKQGHLQGCCPRPCPERSWISPQMNTSQPVMAIWPWLSPQLEWKCFLVVRWILMYFGLWALILSSDRAPLRRGCVSLPLPSAIYTHHQEPSSMQNSSSFLSFSLYARCFDPLIIFPLLEWKVTPTPHLPSLCW